jgi:hypothetical protein
VIGYRFCALATCLNDLMAQGASERDAIAKASFFGALFLPQSSTRVDRNPEGLQSAQLTLQQEHTREILKGRSHSELRSRN